MKKLLTLLLAIFVGVNIASAQKRMDLGNGVKLVLYGNFTIVEDDNTQRSWRLEIKEQGRNSAGEQLYYLMCKNEYTKSVTKAYLFELISTAVKAIGDGLSIATGNTSTSAAAPAVALASTKIANVIYDNVCRYFE